MELMGFGEVTYRKLESQPWFLAHASEMPTAVLVNGRHPLPPASQKCLLQNGGCPVQPTASNHAKSFDFLTGRGRFIRGCLTSPGHIIHARDTSSHILI